ncbi:HPP-domain-containing protein [Dissoconium aciculare CBS 342.82]|uniref:HPP-domain-containing protein n=1 Tax=Dissoconium aciculare CBS 342.82 TaxID=1314786 RepID=A0A6J3M3Y4_9PEZI|nr:HPP-domain-containing protein [Dissoconium aciculare CBS 342.82]KAF1822730.1 HPP-domain-containing protein [Dissoconium aciculare CBS 342.82]
MASSQSDKLSYQLLHFNIDRYLNPWIPRNRLNNLPKPISKFLGYRSEKTEEIPPALQWPFMFLATVAGLCLVAGINNYAAGFGPRMGVWSGPTIIASFGASAVLDFNAIRTPFSQPRNSIVGNTLSALIGVCIAKLFMLNPAFEEINWVAGAVACACASLLMSITNTVHPPGGATAVLAATNVDVIRMGWRFIPVVLLGSSLLVTVALIFNNILRQYPVFWWTPEKCGAPLRREQREEKEQQQQDKAAEEGNAQPRRSNSTASSDRTLHTDLQRNKTNETVPSPNDIRIHAHGIQVPSHLQLSEEETALLERLRQRLPGAHISQ